MNGVKKDCVYARTKENPVTGERLPMDEWQELAEHQQGVAEKSAEFSVAFGYADIGYNNGLLHDVGKRTIAFQDKLKAGLSDYVDHKTEGARQAENQFGKYIGKIMAYAICGHHNGLPGDISVDGKAGLAEMLMWSSGRLLGNNLELREVPQTLNPPNAIAREHQAFFLTMLIRMFHSALVDADYLDTEKFLHPEVAEKRELFPTIDELHERFQPKLSELLNYPIDSSVNAVRREVLNACLEKAKSIPGIFSLTVPTGGGKTFSSLAFALEHAKEHQMKRIIYAIPFTSITEQTTNVFRDVLGQDAVVEHQSKIDASADEKENERLASENWDAPLIVTTNVQLFESLFSGKPMKSRKLHNLVNSIIIMDEAQMLPDKLLRPSLAAIKCLAADFGATVVFCTATQPSIKAEWLDGNEPQEIIHSPAVLYEKLKRVEVIHIGSISDERLVFEMKNHHQILCIVNTRRHAKEIFDLLGDDEAHFHLSALMCPEHRTEILPTIHERLNRGDKCIVVSTSIIEAGIDVDFPTVYRANAGLDSIAQAAGRCNREGKLMVDGEKVLGKVFVFTPEHRPPKGWLSQMALLGEEVLRMHENPLSPEAISNFFALRYGLGANLDELQIMRDIVKGAGSLSFNFMEMGQKFKMIDSNTIDVIIPFDDKCKEILSGAEYSKFKASKLRKLQRYVVGIYECDFVKLRDADLVDEFTSGVFYLKVSDTEFANIYSSKSGLNVDSERDPIFI